MKVYKSASHNRNLTIRRKRVLLPALAALACCGAIVSCRAQQNASPKAQTGPVTFRIDATKGRAPISPFIYGANDGGILPVTKGLTLARLGGNRMSAFNWENNASNAGSDYINQNDGIMGGGDAPGAVVKGNIERAFQNNASIIVTVPMLDYVAADKNGGGDINQTPNFQHTRLDANRARKGRAFVFPPDTSDKAVYQDEMVAFVEKTFPNAHDNTSKTIFYALDNEPDLWGQTHGRIYPQHPTYADVLKRGIEFSGAIKSVAPKAMIFGPVSYGFQGYINLQNAPDANGRNFLDFYLDGMRQASTAQGKRLLDVLDIHWYPEAYGGSHRIVEANDSPEVVEARVQAPRSLWDPTYKEYSWIATKLGGPIRLLPRLKEQIAQHYPGTKIAMTEYCYGSTSTITGGVAQADVVGIFGREGVFAANFFTMSGDGGFCYGAFNCYRNYDGKGAHVGDTYIQSDTSDIVRSSVYGSVDSADPKKMYIVALNKTTAPLPADIAIASPVSFSQAVIFQLTGESKFGHPGGTASITGNRLKTTLPPMSVSTFVLHP